MSMPAVRAGNVVGPLEGFADADGNGLFSDIKMCETRHQRAGVEFVYLVFKQTDRQHLTVHPVPESNLLRSSSRLRSSCQLGTPDMRASTSNITAKSSFSQPIPR